MNEKVNLWPIAIAIVLAAFIIRGCENKHVCSQVGRYLWSKPSTGAWGIVFDTATGSRYVTNHGLEFTKDGERLKNGLLWDVVADNNDEVNADKTTKGN